MGHGEYQGTCRACCEFTPVTSMGLCVFCADGFTSEQDKNRVGAKAGRVPPLGEHGVRPHANDGGKS